MSSRNAIRLIEPRSGAVTRPMQKYHLVAHADKRRQHVRPSDKTDWWRPVDRNGVVSIDNDKSRPSPVRFVWTVERYLRAICVTARDIATIRALLTLDAGGGRG